MMALKTMEEAIGVIHKAIGNRIGKHKQQEFLKDLQPINTDPITQQIVIHSEEETSPQNQEAISNKIEKSCVLSATSLGILLQTAQTE